MSPKSIIQLVDVTKRYRTGGDVIYAVNHFNLQILEGEFVFVMGPSGSGKSTLLNLISGTSLVTDGIVRILDYDVHKMSETGRALVRRAHIGIVFQFYNLHEGMNAQENVELPMLIAGIPKRDRTTRAIELLQMVGLDDRNYHLPYELSGGERQRVGIARALANDAKIVLADEPTGDLDHATAQMIIDLFLRLNKDRGVTIIMVSHDITLIRKGFRLITLTDGKVIRDEVVDDPDKILRELNPFLPEIAQPA